MSERDLWVRITLKNHVKLHKISCFMEIAVLLNGFKCVALQGN